MEQYSAAWQAIMQLVRKGSSWSGYERNGCFLNTGGTFASAAHVSGLDFRDDGRGLAVTDWDQDGDLDLWFRNRTAPRLRLMLNQSADSGNDRFVAFRLVGKTANRDAIGAVVELEVAGCNERLVRSVRAGEMYLSQSSKWVHFGIPEAATIKKVNVLWPGGDRESFDHVEISRRYVLEQGTAKAMPEKPQRTVTLEPAPLATQHTSTGLASIVLPAPVPLPITDYVDEKGSEKALSVTGKPLLLTLWSSECPHCESELTQLATSIPADLDVLVLCVDGNTSDARTAAERLLSQVGYSGAWGMIGGEGLERVHVLQEALFDKTPDFAVPFSLLVRPGNDIVAIYRGPISSEALIYDAQYAVTASDTELRNLAPPFPGRWFTLPAAPAFLPNMIAQRIQARYPEDAISYLHLATEKADSAQKPAMLAELGRKHYSLARKFVKKQMAKDAEYHFTRSLEANPNVAGVHNDFGTMLAQLGRMEEGAQHFAEAVRLKPDYPLAKRNLERARALLNRPGNDGK